MSGARVPCACVPSPPVFDAQRMDPGPPHSHVEADVLEEQAPAGTILRRWVGTMHSPIKALRGIITAPLPLRDGNP